MCTLGCTAYLDNLDLCPVSELGSFSKVDGAKEAPELFPMLWRFLPAMDDQVETFLSRDIDSNLNMRER